MRFLFKHSLIVIIFLLLPNSLRAESGLEQRFSRTYHHKLGDRLFESEQMPGHLRMALKHYREAFRSSQKQSWKVARCYWALARTASDEKEKLGYLQKGAKHVKAILKDNPDSPGVNLWHFMIMESLARERGTANMLHASGKIKKGFEEVLKLDPGNIKAYLGLARMSFYAPSSSKNDKAEAFRQVEKALKVNPDNSSALLLKAKFLVKEQKSAQALKILKRLSRMPLSASGEVTVWNKVEAAELIDQLDESQHPF